MGGSGIIWVQILFESWVETETFIQGGNTFVQTWAQSLGMVSKALKLFHEIDSRNPADAVRGQMIYPVPVSLRRETLQALALAPLAVRNWPASSTQEVDRKDVP